MESAKEITEVLDHLMRINRDRVEAYTHASYDTSSSDLKDIFSQMADESRRNITDLTREIMNYYYSPPLKELEEREIYKKWKKEHFQINHQNISMVLSLCESSESAALKAYQESMVLLSRTPSAELVSRQEEYFKSSLDVIKAYRKAYSRVLND
jgi:uncharacterized protein (TIGR02284 family)